MSGLKGRGFTKVMKKVFDETDARMEKAIEALRGELSKVRTGRASVTLLEGVKVDYYGSPTPLNQVATLSAPESRLITVQPWDISQIQPIEKAISSADLGLTPSNDGKIIRIQVPALTEERRKEFVKLVRKYAEECRISIRNARREANETLKKMEKDKDISEDDCKKGQEEVQDITDSKIKKVDSILSAKEADIMEV